jgi:signal transduction histidine kinase
LTPRAWFQDLGRRFGLTARLAAILLSILVVDFGINSLQFERQSALAVSSDEVTRLAELLSIARRVMDATPPVNRPEAARRLTTERLTVAWQPGQHGDDTAPPSAALYRQVVAEEPDLAGAGLRLHPVPTATGQGIAGSATLEDGTSIDFSASPSVTSSLSLWLFLRFSLPSVVLFALGWWLVRRSTLPLSALVRATSQVGTDDMDPLPEEGEREVRLLVRAFNRMHDRIHQLITSRTQAMLAIGHDLRTPMARIQLRLDGVQLDEGTRAGLATDIAEMSSLLDSLRVFVESGEEGGPAELIDLASMVRTQVDEAADHGSDATYSGPDRLEVIGHALGLRRASSNLIQNALRHAGSVEVTLSSAGQEVRLDFADRGPGIPEDSLAEVRQPFFRLDEARGRNTSGMGLGLAIVDRIVTAEGGRFTLANRSGGGLVATIALPLRQSAPTRLAKAGA